MALGQKKQRTISEGLTDLCIQSLGMDCNDIFYVGTDANGSATSETEGAHIFRTNTAYPMH